MNLRNLNAVVLAALTALFAVGIFYPQEHAEHNVKQAHAKSDAPEIFCSHLGTAQLCPGNADMFKLSGPQKQAYLEALNSYNKAVAVERFEVCLLRSEEHTSELQSHLNL